MSKYLYNNYVENLSSKFLRRIEEIEFDHNFEAGDEFEYAICNILQSFLPSNFGVTRGFVVKEDGTKCGDDIIIYDRHRFPTLRLHDKNQYHRLENIPIEAVYAYIEAKHTIEYKFNDYNCTFFKALDQSLAAKLLIGEREARSHKKFSPYMPEVPLMGEQKGNLLPKISNPPFSCIIARNFKCTPFKDEVVDYSSIDFLTNHLLIPQDKYKTLPDLIVLNKDIVLVPRLYEIEKDQTVIFKEGLLFCHLPNATYTVLIRPNIAYGIFLCHLLYAIDWIILDKMPWSKILFDAQKV